MGTERKRERRARARCSLYDRVNRKGIRSVENSERRNKSTGCGARDSSIAFSTNLLSLSLSLVNFCSPPRRNKAAFPWPLQGFLNFSRRVRNEISARESQRGCFSSSSSSWFLYLHYSRGFRLVRSTNIRRVMSKVVGGAMQREKIRVSNRVAAGNEERKNRILEQRIGLFNSPVSGYVTRRNNPAVAALDHFARAIGG